VSFTNADERANPASARIQLSFERLLSRSGLIAGTALLLATALAWWWLIVSDMNAMESHGMGVMAIETWTTAYLVPAFMMWAVMMVAMMLPSAAPMILLHARIDRTSSPARHLLHTLLFAVTYLLVWSAFSATAAFAQALLIDLGLVSAMTLALSDRALAAILLVAAALYQLSPVKAACLNQCRSPIHFVMRYWSPGIRGTMRLGLVHGWFCVGCCWGLMLLLFVAGVMNLAWVALLAAIVFVEKVSPPAWRMSKLVAGLLLAGAVALLASG